MIDNSFSSIVYVSLTLLAKLTLYDTSSQHTQKPDFELTLQ